MYSNLFPFRLEGQVITVNEFFNLVQKETLTSEEEVEVLNFKNFIRNYFRLYQDTSSNEVQKVVNDFMQGLRILRNSGRDDLADNLESDLDINQNLKRILIPKEPKQFGGSGGYITSGILILALLNIGIIIATALLSKM